MASRRKLSVASATKICSVDFVVGMRETELAFQRVPCKMCQLLLLIILILLLIIIIIIIL